jgi:adenosylcobinamide-GDP ribazoletransferase
MKHLAAALGFLSVFPLPARWQEQAALARSLPYFPVVGLVFGAVAAALAAGLAELLPPAPAGVLLVIALALLSGGLHVDGLADTADGFFSSRPKERILEIMRDSRTGAMGAAAVASVLLLKYAAVASLPPHWFVRGAFLMPLAGRCSLLLAMIWLPYARPGGGLATVFGSARPWHALWAVVLLGGSSWFVATWRGLAAAALVIIVTALLSRWSWRKIGGYTGDTLGATCEIIEAIPALVLASQLWPGGAR